MTDTPDRAPRFVSRAADLAPGSEFPWIADGLAFGGDYNPEQWPESVWAEDVALMQRAGVTTVSLGIFSWGLLEVADGEFDWGWLDRILDLLHDGGIGVDLATPTAAPPSWLLTAHPEIATVDAQGVRTSGGARLSWSPSSVVFRRYALRFVRALAERYGSHPALRMWHVGNELGNENATCYSDETALAWQAWLSARFGEVGALNAAWGTAFWGHRYTDFAQVLPPRASRSGHNPGLLLDFERFTSDALLGHYLAEREVLREVTPRVPITTNFMVMNNPGIDDYARWAQEVDLVANDHYTISSDPHREAELSYSADRVRGMAGGQPWIVMEHSTSAVNWQPVNRAKQPGELLRNSLQHIAHGADGALFFQWRASTAGAEQFHSAMVPHAGADSKVFREVCELGAALRSLAPVRGTTVDRARVALLWDHQAAVALRSGRGPSELIRYNEMGLALHRALAGRGIAVDVIRPSDGFADYDIVLAPTLYLVDDESAAALARFVEAGGHALVTYLSGIVDPANRVRAGAYPGAFRELLGIRVEEFFPLFDGETVTVSIDGGDDDGRASGTLWSELLHLDGAEALATYSGGSVGGDPLARTALDGIPAATRRSVGAGSARYLATLLDDASLGSLLDGLLAEAGVGPVADADRGLEIVRRSGAEGSYLFAINHTDSALSLRSRGVELLTGATVDGHLDVAPGTVAVVREAGR